MMAGVLPSPEPEANHSLRAALPQSTLTPANLSDADCLDRHYANWAVNCGSTSNKSATRP